jgi:transcriptional regulator with XRE-family HTH domain
VDYETVKRALAAEVQAWRKSHRVSQERLSELSDRTRHSIRRLEGLEINPKLETVVLIANAMHVSLTQLFAAVEKRCVVMQRSRRD